MQTSQAQPHELLTALQVQNLLQVDRSTVYRMAEDGRLPAIRVGRSWRFPAEQIEAMLSATTAEDAGPGGATAPPPPSAAPSAAGPAEHASPAVSPTAATAAVEVAADLLGVMMVVTDMHGQPLTRVSNPSRWYAERAGQPEVLQACVAEWRDLADHPDLAPRFQSGELGFECARAFIRVGTTLVGMVLAGGVSPAGAPPAADLYHLDGHQRERVLAALPRIAAAIARSTPPGADTTTADRDPGAAPKENR